MTITLRILLFIGAAGTMFYFIRQIGKNRMQIDYAIFWSLFSGMLVLMSIFPGVITAISKLLGVESPSNLVYLVIIFVLIIKQFTNTIKVSKLNQQLSELTQHIALEEYCRNGGIANQKDKTLF